MVTPVVSSSLNPENVKYDSAKPPLFRPDPKIGVAPPRPKSRAVCSRYLTTKSSSSSSVSVKDRCASPRTNVSNATTPVAIKRSQSVEHRRAMTPKTDFFDLRTKGEISAAQRMLFTSTRSVPVSFQGESFPLLTSKTKPAPSLIDVRRDTPERRRMRAGISGQMETPKLPEQQQRWPGSRKPSPVSRSMDYSDERKKMGGSHNNVVRVVHNSIINKSTAFNGGLSTKLADSEKEKDGGLNDVRSYVVVSDTESVSSGSTASVSQEEIANRSFDCAKSYAQGQPINRVRGTVVPARIWQETNNRLRCQIDPGPPLSRPPKPLAQRKISVDSPISSPKGALNRRTRFPPASPLVHSSPLKGISPSRTRIRTVEGLGGNETSQTSVLSFAVNVKRGKIGENRFVDAHSLRLLHNRLLQWRFSNARAEAALSAQRLDAERSLFNAWMSISKLLESIRAKRTELRFLRHILKLNLILQKQMIYLEDCAAIDREYSACLFGAIKALRATTLRLPLCEGATADVQCVKEAIFSADNVMQDVIASIYLLFSKVGEMNSLVSELADVSGKEHLLLGHFRELLSTNAAMQVTECSLRAHIKQLQRATL